MLCSDCCKDHSHQIKDYPVGATVEAIETFEGSVDNTKANHLEGYFPRTTIPAGSLGEVVGHTNDGRAIIEWEAEKGKSPAGHTFHYPETFFKILDEIKLTPDEYRTLSAFIARIRDKKDIEDCLNDYTHNGLTTIASGVSKLVRGLRLIGWDIKVEE